ncbi:MAG: hypothetical protein A3C02_00320 [Candidatus Andersenbacteria bacterium RIFCSPHIGHO2_02_FULL_45_11]|uniref:Peptidase S11 D-alanyl-D-alanine carboxypeptidase A N-terminal domain-containing protein n=1 Tax=Candidatus Andersenbacteria bacterium RIFCSPHIGHO2_12_FULL_45_11 TaxID=1797281 RepID=A0A1G1X1T5_9BACT|nr:MAG: hypothetical protein A2805_02230 [Candidatus Andersenbacteria bacterium RIFCSPHIGHO2_01_FULL_46_36]OGY33975.1 MAG: hypothetical protein A3D99_04120 [Candidatus Andersenbacteria bacterium RIFCSPHIGHO2_12_FULL_45_11]OGY34542.1 MAG: hypothetical protein A3C02_00320 [Candidatus Andersenbacteria bacterium RIFCSPHIGHO2_02_FULL_45_11]
MHKATLIFACICIILAGGMGVVVWQLMHAPESSIPLEGGSSILLGIPGISTKSSPEADVRASSALLYSTETNSILYEHGAFDRRPLASITKLMTAMVALDHGISWNTEANILPQEYVQGGELVLTPGETVTMKDLFNASLLGSANNATLAYVRQLGISQETFVQEMNRKAIALGLEQTEFTDVTGLSPQNVSTAYEIARMAHHAFSEYPEISQATSQRDYTFTMRGTGREHTIKNTNKPVHEGSLEVIGSKTGFLYEAGYCLVVEGTGKYKNMLAVVMDTPSEQAQFIEIERLLKMQRK